MTKNAPIFRKRRREKDTNICERGTEQEEVSEGEEQKLTKRST